MVVCWNYIWQDLKKYIYNYISDVQEIGSAMFDTFNVAGVILEPETNIFFYSTGSYRWLGIDIKDDVSFAIPVFTLTFFYVFDACSKDPNVFFSQSIGILHDFSIFSG